MPGTLGDAYIHIIPTTEGISDNITKALGGESEKAGKTAGKSMLGGIATVVGGGAAALAGAATVIGGTMIAGAKGAAETTSTRCPRRSASRRKSIRNGTTSWHGPGLRSTS